MPTEEERALLDIPAATPVTIINGLTRDGSTARCTSSTR
jgi:hypothetical protein